MESANNSTPAAPPRQVNDVSPANPEPKPTPAADPGHMPVRPAPDGQALSVPKDAPATPQVSASQAQKPKPSSEKSNSATGIVIVTILVMLALSALAMVAYMNSRA